MLSKSDIPPFAAIILNGGGARRMGGVDKSQILVEGQSIFRRQLAVLRQRTDRIAVAQGNAPHRDCGQDIYLLADRSGGLGPIDGIAAGLAWLSDAPSEPSWILVVAGDMPYISLSVVDSLLAARDANRQAQVVGTVLNGRAQPLFALYHQSVLPYLDECLTLKRLRASALFDSQKLATVLIPQSEIRDVDPDLRSFHNINSPADSPVSK